jgi:hypothetical protein
MGFDNRTGFELGPDSLYPKDTYDLAAHEKINEKDHLISPFQTNIVTKLKIPQNTG